MIEKLNELIKFRQQIDKVDNELLKTLAKRFKIIKKIYQFKKKSSLPLIDKKREKELLKKRDLMAQKLNLDRKLVRNIFLCILKTVKKEYGKLKKNS